MTKKDILTKLFNAAIKELTTLKENLDGDGFESYAEEITDIITKLSQAKIHIE